ncbi:DUF3795 domain-containing protein [Bacilliculturomica massiliensis]|uniref:DUF3795 domain-containing protein n=1 Tax=Bacilliculturomica massiliensis TaxID=1917867 RepID=UPI00103184D7|nr:DUF3795 domain-containing protein [Bacilliculturomica massiliensis]
MKDFSRKDLNFSLCGLNCALCPMKLGGYCPGCGGGEGNQSCSIARCSMKRAGIAYCFQCGEHPCEKYVGIDQFDSFLPHNQLKNFARAEKIGLEGYLAELEEKSVILRHLLERCNDGRRKSFYCTAVNLLEIQELRAAVERMESLAPEGTTVKEMAAAAVQALQDAAAVRGIELKLKKKPKKK